MASQQFCVRWNSYQSNLQNAFPKLLLNENFVDVTLACEAQSIKCHKVVLSACSTYFEQLLSQNPCQHPIIFMKDMKFWEIRALVDFMYRGEVNVTQEELSSLLRAAEALQVRGLYGYEQQRAAAAAGIKTPTEASGDDKRRKPPDEKPLENKALSVSLPTTTTTPVVERKPSSASRASTPQDDTSNDQMVKLEEDIMLMEEQSLSDLESSQLDQEFSGMTSQEFESFGEQASEHCFSATSSLLDQQAGPSGLTMTPTTTPAGDKTSQDGMFYDWKLPDYQKTERQPTFWESLPKEDMAKHLSLAVDMIEGGNSYRRVSNLLHIPKSTIYSYVLKRREGVRRIGPFSPSLPLQSVACLMGPSSGDEEGGPNQSPVRRIRRSEKELSEAAGCISQGLTFQSVSNRYKIPISTIRFYMARRGILPRRKRGRTHNRSLDDNGMEKNDQSSMNGSPLM